MPDILIVPYTPPVKTDAIPGEPVRIPNFCGKMHTSDDASCDCKKAFIGAISGVRVLHVQTTALRVKRREIMKIFVAALVRENPDMELRDLIDYAYGEVEQIEVMASFKKRDHIYVRKHSQLIVHSLSTEAQKNKPEWIADYGTSAVASFTVGSTSHSGVVWTTTADEAPREIHHNLNETDAERQRRVFEDYADQLRRAQDNNEQRIREQEQQTRQRYRELLDRGTPIAPPSPSLPKKIKRRIGRRRMG
jgi:hypothetical protein